MKRAHSSSDCRVQSVLFHLDYARGLRPWPSLVNPKFANFVQNFLIGYSIFRREKPFADEKQSYQIWGHVARDQERQCILGYGCDFPPKMAALVQS